MANQKSVLFVCLGNICRSPIAEGVFMDAVKKRGVESQWKIDSAAIGSWHTGKKPDHRAQETMKKHGIDYNNRARQVKKDDFLNFDYIFGMDDENMDDLRRLSPPNSKAKVSLLGDFDPEGVKLIRDPYYDSGSEGFEQCYVQCVRCVTAFLDKLNE